MRVLHLIDTGGPGGAETICADVAQGMSARGFDPVVVVPMHGWLSEELARRGVPTHVVPSSGRMNLSFLTRLYGLIRRERAELLHTHLLASAVYGGVAATMAGVPVVSTFHGMADAPGHSAALRLKFRIIRHCVSRVAFVSQSLLDDFVARLPLDASRTAVVYNGVRELEVPVEATVRRELDLDENTVLVGAVGNVRPSKSYDVFLHAAQQVLAERADVRFVIVGDDANDLGDGLRQLARQLGIAGSVTFLGFRPDVAAIFRALDVFVVSSSADGFSLASVQAMFAGVPVVATRCGGPEEILDHDRTGLLVPRGDPRALARAITRLLDDRALREGLTREASLEARRRFSLETMLARYETMYRESLGERGTHRRKSGASVGPTSTDATELTARRS